MDDEMANCVPGYRFSVPGECRGKMRPKASVFAGHARVHSPDKQVEYENWVRMCFLQRYGEGNPYPKDVPMRATIHVYMAIPKSMPKYKAEKAMINELRPTKAPDADNCAKSILDALNGLAYEDDSQIVSLAVEKLYAKVPSASVFIEVCR